MMWADPYIPDEAFFGFTQPRGTPTALVGLTAVAGGSPNYMPADAAPALSQTISPTMTGNWTFTPGSGFGLVVNGTANVQTVKLVASSTSGQSQGLLILAGTTSADVPLQVRNAGNTQNFFVIFGDGSATLSNANGNLAFSATGTLALSAPSSGIALTINGAASSQCLSLTGATATGASIKYVDGNTGNRTYTVGAGVSVTGAWEIYDNSANAQRFQVASTGAVTVDAPSSGTALTVKAASTADAIDIWAGGANGGALIRAYDSTGATNVGYLDFISGTGGVGGATETVLANLGSTANDYLSLVSGGLRRVQISGTGIVLAPATPVQSAKTSVITGLANFLSSSTTRSSSTLANEAGLSVTVNETGWYRIEARMYYYEATSGNGGFKANFGGGTLVASNVVLTALSFDPPAAGLVSSGASLSSPSYADPGVVSTSASTPSWMNVDGVMQVTTAGTLVVQWAQNSTLAIDPTTLLAGSHIILTKIG
jgi:hypothetical protein